MGTRTTRLHPSRRSQILACNDPRLLLQDTLLTPGPPQNGPIQYTDADLKAYDGTDPTKPILLAINGTIYDVSNGRKHYGPEGSYHLFAGADASRGFVTGCFDTDRTPDMRGVEEMFLPLDDPEIDGL
jgi:predicted heme/steroid binding protein